MTLLRTAAETAVRVVHKLLRTGDLLLVRERELELELENFILQSL